MRQGTALRWGAAMTAALLLGCGGGSVEPILPGRDRATTEPEASSSGLTDRRQWRRFEVAQQLRMELQELRSAGAATDAFEARVVDSVVAACERFGDASVVELVADLAVFDGVQCMLEALPHAETNDAAVRWFREVEVPTAARSTVVRRLAALLRAVESSWSSRGLAASIVEAIASIPGPSARNSLLWILGRVEVSRGARFQAVRELGRRAESEALQPLVDSIVANHLGVDGELEELGFLHSFGSALSAYGPDSFGPLMELGRGENHRALRMVEARQLSRGVQGLPNSDAHAVLAVASIEVLAMIGDPRAVDPMIEATRSSNHEERLAAAVGLAEFVGYERHRRSLAVIEVFRRHHLDGDQGDLGGVFRLAEALGKIEDPESIPAMLEIAAWIQAVRRPAGLDMAALYIANQSEVEDVLAWAEGRSPERREALHSAAEEFAPMVRRCRESAECYLAELETMLEGNPSRFDVNRERLNKAFAMLRRYGTAQHVGSLPHWVQPPTRHEEIDSSLTVESLGGAQAIEYLQGQETERAVRLRRRLMLREMFATP